MAHAWAAFIRTGDPSTEELPWPAFTPDGRRTMVFDTQTRVETDPTAPYRSVDE
jgi:para-nitrobenzyl esterase